MKFRIIHFHCGIGGSAIGAAAAEARFGDHDARFETVGGIDIDPRACRDFERLTGAPALCADMHTLTPAKLRKLAGKTAPDVLMSSPPCKGFSALLGAKKASEEKYQTMNGLLLSSLFLACSTWDQPPALIFYENVPRIESRGKELVARAIKTLQAHGYSVTVGSHDCGELGSLAQHRRRWFLLARHQGRVPQFVYQPPKERVRACGEVLGPMPMPGDVELGGPMHSVPKLSMRNWVRLALIPAGGDWRDLPGVLGHGEKRRAKFRRAPVTAWSEPAETVVGPGGSASAAVADPRFGHVDRMTDWDSPVGAITSSPAPSSGAGAVADPRFANVMRVASWEEPAPTVIGASRPGGGAISVADPRWGGGRLGVTGWNEAAATVTGESFPSNGRNAVADPRLAEALALAGRRNDDLGVVDWNDPASTITGDARPRKGRFSVADPRFADGKRKNWQQVAGVTPWSEPGPTITSGAKIHAGAFQVADPRISCRPRAGAYRVLRWDEAAATISGSLSVDNGAAAVADPRLDPDRAPPFLPIIIAADNTWHRPLTTLELAVLQSFPAIVDGKPLVLDGTSHTRWREAIGNAVPPDAAEAIGDELLRALLLSALGVWSLSSNEYWARERARVGAIV